MTRSIAPAAAPATDTRTIKRSRQDDPAMRGEQLGHHAHDQRRQEDRRMSRGIDRARERLIKAQVLRKPDQRHRDRDIAEAMAEAFRRAGLLPSHIEPETPLLDVPPYQRGFGVMDEDAPGDGDAG